MNSCGATVGSEFDLGAGDACESFLARSTMALFTPLCVAAGRVPRAVSWLAAAGFEVPYVRSLRLRREQVEGLWEQLIPRVAKRRVDVVTQALTAGPSALVALRRAPDGVSAAEHLTRIKGAADPSLRQEPSLRSHLGAPSLLTSLVHTPDDPGNLLRELRVLLPDLGEFEAFWLAQRTGPALDDDSLPSFLSGEAPPPPVDALTVALRTQARLLARLAEGASARAARALGQLTTEVLRELEVAESDPFDPLGALARHRAGCAPRLDRLRLAVADDSAAAGREVTHRLACHAYEQLASVVAGEPFDLDVLTITLQNSGAPVNVWERLVLASEWVAPSPQRPGFAQRTSSHDVPAAVSRPDSQLESQRRSPTSEPDVTVSVDP